MSPAIPGEIAGYPVTTLWGTFCDDTGSYSIHLGTVAIPDSVIRMNEPLAGIGAVDCIVFSEGSALEELTYGSFGNAYWLNEDGKQKIVCPGTVRNVIIASAVYTSNPDAWEFMYDFTIIP